MFRGTFGRGLGERLFYDFITVVVFVVVVLLLFYFLLLKSAAKHGVTAFITKDFVSCAL